MTDLRVELPGSDEWRRLWEATGREPYAHPAYLGLTPVVGERAVAACWSDDNGEVLLPLLLRPLPDEPWVPTVADGWSDAVSPYGYGGPFVAGEPDLGAFMGAVLSWMRDDHVLTGFVRASLDADVPESVATDGYEVLHLSDNVVVDLSRSPEDRWRHYEHKVRKNVNKARRHDLRVEVREDFGDVAEFVAIYHDTMQRRGAAERYHLGADYFARVRDEMGGSYWVADVLDPDGRVLSTELVLVSDRFCYSFLGGTLAEAFPMAPNDLLKHEVMEHATRHGLAGYVLGGGYEPGDGIFRYKRAFDPDGVRAFRGIQLVASGDVYAQLASARPGVVADTFFPAYRAP